jgi:type II secretory pathway pseudopilin PulG
LKIAHKNRTAGGFSLVELLLTMVLVLCLAAAAVFSFTAIYRSANLDEGNDRFQALIRFAQAEAATSGRKVRLQFEPAEGAASNGAELRRIRVTWEADYLNAPGVFQTHTNKAWSEEMVNELVGVQTVKPLAAGAARPGSGAPVALENESIEDFFGAMDFPAITFYPDGSCDSAEIVLASLNTDDGRRLAVRISGILGTVSSRAVSAEAEAIEEEEEYPDEAAAPTYDDVFQSSPPIAALPE